jgi:GntR family transcriptional regulator/MocR family aminotransferase
MRRREMLLDQAEQQDFVVIEDDYEAENLYEGERHARAQESGQIGTCHLCRIGVQKPVALTASGLYSGVARLDRRIARIAPRHGASPSAFLQHAFALFLSLGHHDAHARRVNQAMQERMALVADALTRYLPDFAFQLPSGGASVSGSRPGLGRFVRTRPHGAQPRCSDRSG